MYYLKFCVKMSVTVFERFFVAFNKLFQILDQTGLVSHRQKLLNDMTCLDMSDGLFVVGERFLKLTVSEARIAFLRVLCSDYLSTVDRLLRTVDFLFRVPKPFHFVAAKPFLSSRRSLYFHNGEAFPFATPR